MGSFLLVALGTLACLPAQEPKTIQGTRQANLFGTALLGIGDADRDGHDDFVAGARWGTGETRAFSGRTGEVLYSIPEAARRGLGHALLLLGDLDEDGVQDFANIGCRSGFQGELQIVSGRTGSEIRSVAIAGPRLTTCGVPVGAIGDVDGDHVTDLVVPLRRATSEDPSDPIATVFSAVSGKALFDFENPLPPGSAIGGLATCWSGPKSRSRLLIATYGPKEPSVLVVDDRGRLVRTYPCPEDDLTVAQIGDLDGDGVVDHFIAGYFDSSSAVWIYSGLTGQLLREHPAPESCIFYGQGIFPAGDVDQDGVSDYMVSDPERMGESFGGGTVWLYSGRTGVVIHRWIAQEEWDFGTFAAGLGDV